MSTGTPAARSDVEDRLDELEQRLESLQMDVKQSGNLAKDAIQTANEALQQVDDVQDNLSGDVRELEARFDDLADRTDLLKHVKQASALSRDEKAVVCLQTLVTEAQDGDGRAAMNAREAKKALGGGVDRTLMYKILPHAADLVDDEDVVWWQTESRSSQQNSRLIIDLTNGDVPGSIEGYDLTGGEEV